MRLLLTTESKVIISSTSVTYEIKSRQKGQTGLLWCPKETVWEFKSQLLFLFMYLFQFYIKSNKTCFSDWWLSHFKSKGEKISYSVSHVAVQTGLQGLHLMSNSILNEQRQNTLQMALSPRFREELWSCKCFICQYNNGTNLCRWY